jgi:hypothetical protein
MAGSAVTMAGSAVTMAGSAVTMAGSVHPSTAIVPSAPLTWQILPACPLSIHAEPALKWPFAPAVLRMPLHCDHTNNGPLPWQCCTSRFDANHTDLLCCVVLLCLCRSCRASAQPDFAFGSVPWQHSICSVFGVHLTLFPQSTCPHTCSLYCPAMCRASAHLDISWTVLLGNGLMAISTVCSV